jgi:signal transduction histidine kinase
VSDNGNGITAASLPHVFDPFMQDAHAIGFNGSGLGIGLTVVRELVEAHGGTIVATSAGSHLGSQFVVTLPR